MRRWRVLFDLDGVTGTNGTNGPTERRVFQLDFRYIILARYTNFEMALLLDVLNELKVSTGVCNRPCCSTAQVACFHPMCYFWSCSDFLKHPVSDVDGEGGVPVSVQSFLFRSWPPRIKL